MFNFAKKSLRSARESLLGVLRWDVAPDGKRFLIDTVRTSSEPLTVVPELDNRIKEEISLVAGSALHRES
jgi:hypothetical protein